MLTTRDLILEYCADKSNIVDFKDLECMTAHTISEHVMISRSLASQYLNDFVKEGLLIKIVTRPVSFLHKKSIETRYQIEISDTMFDSIQSLIDVISEHTKIEANFTKMIGHEDSLRKSIDQIKGCLRYPQPRIPLLFHGEEGTGKLLLTRMMFEYAQEQGYFSDDAVLMCFSVPEDEKEQEQLYSEFFGSGNLKGVVSKLNGGILAISHPENLSQHAQDHIQFIIEQGVYETQDGSSTFPFEGYLVFLTDDNYRKTIGYDLLQCFPITCQLPTFENRYFEEREAIVVNFFKKEALRIKKKIRVSEQVIKYLVENRYKQNLDELKRLIKGICVRANLTDSSKVIDIKMYQLFDDFGYGVQLAEGVSDEVSSMVDVLEYRKPDDIERIIELFDRIIDKGMISIRGEVGLDRYVKDISADIRNYFNYLVFENKYANNNVQAIENSINLVFNEVVNTYNINVPINIVAITARMIYITRKYNSSLSQWESSRRKDIESCLDIIGKHYQNENFIVDRIDYLVQSNFEFGLDQINRIMLLLNIIFYNEELFERKYLGIVIAHGYATASSIAASANTLLGSYVFDAFDMPLDTSTLDIIDKLEKYIKRMSIKSDILLLVDMGSLEDLGNNLCMISDKNIGILNNVSTRMALEVGEGILKGKDIQTILTGVSENFVVNYKLNQCEHKPDAIIFVSENGLSMANSMKELFVNSLPKPIDIKSIVIDYHALKTPSVSQEIIENHNVLFISGMITDKNEFDSFISLEEIISMNNISKIKKQLSVYLEPEELDRFSQNLIRNFSLENVVRNLTILEPNKLIIEVEDAVNQMQLRFGRQFYGHTLIGLYIHICCLVERLVTKEPIEMGEVDNFETNHRDSIEIITESFSNISSHYRVGLPLSEIQYLYNYINADEHSTTDYNDSEL